MAVTNLWLARQFKAGASMRGLALYLLRRRDGITKPTDDDLARVRVQVEERLRRFMNRPERPRGR